MNDNDLPLSRVENSANRENLPFGKICEGTEQRESTPKSRRSASTFVTYEKTILTRNSNSISPTLLSPLVVLYTRMNKHLPNFVRQPFLSRHPSIYPFSHRYVLRSSCVCERRGPQKARRLSKLINHSDSFQLSCHSRSLARWLAVSLGSNFGLLGWALASETLLKNLFSFSRTLLYRRKPMIPRGN